MHVRDRIQIARVPLHVVGIDPDRGVLLLGDAVRVEGDRLEHLAHDGAQPARADVLDARVEAGGERGESGDAIGREVQRDALRGQQRGAVG